MKIIEAAKQPALPPPADRAASRTVHLEIFATKELAAAMQARAVKERWTLSAVVENACADSHELASLRKRRSA